MKMSSLVKFFLEMGDGCNPLFNDYEMQKHYLECCPAPKDEIDRAYYQYKCQNKLRSINWVIFYNLVALLILPLLLVKWLLNERRRGITPGGVDAVSVLDVEKLGLLPESLRNKFKRIKVMENKELYLNRNALGFLFRIFRRHPFSVWFYTKIAFKTALYCKYIHEYRTKAVLAASEYSFTSSALTLYCRINGVRHINIMHGEKLFFIRDSFFEFDACYVWDRHYVDLFGRLRAHPKQFILERPPIFNELKKTMETMTTIVDYKFYLASETKNELEKLRDAMKTLIGMGFSVKVRPHPIYSDIKLLERFFQPDELEMPDKVPITKSIGEAVYIVAMYSTVLQQGYVCGKRMVIDNYSCPEKFRKISKLDYIMLSKTHELLTEHLSRKVKGDA